MKPNYSELGRLNNCDPRTIKKYYLHPDARRKTPERHSELEPFDALIADRMAIPGVTMAGAYEFLRKEKGLPGAYVTFTWYCRKKGYAPKGDGKAHVRYETDPGHQVQVDWKEDLKLRSRDGKTVFVFNVYSATLGFSRKHFFYYTENKTEQDFIRLTNRLLRDIGGSVDEILTDNMSAIVSVSEDGRDGRRYKHPNILQWEKDSGIPIRLCRVRSPQTKGKVESSNRFVDRLMAYDGEVESAADIEKAVLEIQREANDKINPDTGMSPQSLFEMKEKQALGKLPNMSLLDSFTDGGTTVKVSHTLLVPFLGRQYSVPLDYLGKSVRILRNGDYVEIYYSRQLIAEHPFDPGKKINYREEDYREGLASAMGRGCDDLDELAEKNLKGFEGR
ncbi:MAG: IS21 family transposase [Eubacteriales bacterium]|nr:IS21 family transposase [Eubacteriales bacterium]